MYLHCMPYILTFNIRNRYAEQVKTPTCLFYYYILYNRMFYRKVISFSPLSIKCNEKYHPYSNPIQQSNADFEFSYNPFILS
jgi:hypothetical protein